VRISFSGFKSDKTCEYDQIFRVSLISIFPSKSSNSHNKVLRNVVFHAQFSQIIQILSDLFTSKYSGSVTIGNVYQTSKL
jgi:hypothetical protein